jgi:hypothetical protein
MIGGISLFPILLVCGNILQLCGLCTQTRRAEGGKAMAKAGTRVPVAKAKRLAWPGTARALPGRRCL